MADTKTFKDIDKKLQKLVDETKANFKISNKWQNKLDEHALGLIDKLEKDRKPRSKVQKEMLRVLETQEAQDKVRNRDKVSADFKMGKATIEELKAAKLTKQDLIKSGFGGVSSNIELMRQWFQEGIGKFTSAIKGWWENIKKNSAVLQAAKKFWQSTAITKLKDLFGHVAGIIGSHMREVLGEFAEFFDVFKRVFGAIKDTIVNTFTGVFDVLKERKKIAREKMMNDHLKKIKEGIGFLVKGDKLDAITGGKKQKGGLFSGLLGKLFGLLGLGSIAAFASTAGIGALLGFVWVAIANAIRKMVNGWLENGFAGLVKGYMIGITDIPRSIIAWVAGLFGADKLAAALSDESMDKFLDDITNGISDFMDSIVTWFSDTWTKLENLFDGFWERFLKTMPKWARNFILSDNEEVNISRSKTNDAIKKLGTGLTEDKVRTNFRDARKSILDHRNALQKQEGTDNTKEIKKMTDQLEMLNENMQKALEKSEPTLIFDGAMSSYSGGGQQGNINTYPQTDTTLNMKNNNFYGMG